MKPKIKDSLANIASNPLDFTCKRLPNFWEAVITSTSQATMDTFTGRTKLWFGDNPTASAVFRDVSKLPSIYANIYENNTLGYTDIKYDEGSLWSHGVKVICKGALLTASQFTPVIQTVEFATLARTTNYICEVPNRFLSIATREKQRFEKVNPESKKQFWKFVSEDSEGDWWKEATSEAMVKTTISDQLGEAVKWAGYIPWIRESANIIDNVIATSVGGTIPFAPGDDLWAKGYKSFAMYGMDIRTPVVFLTTAAIDWTAKFTTEMINAYILGTPTRTFQDLTGVAVREFDTFSSNSTAVELLYNQTSSYLHSYLGEQNNTTTEL